ncbi:hypothetical protein MTR67_053459 [Solanum verrucosum]|uniref:cytokinin dehydrogenase n=1 Tax=Solanum verrucosum TaxID=315347 RepID=A0AAF0VA36_SOLVR|nr:hypothetical protein MTR67_053459 [Solanum verrucosum]
MSILGKLNPWNPSIPYEILSLNISSKLSTNAHAIKESSKDFGKIIQEILPAAVLYPSCVNDIIDLIQFSHDLSVPFHVAAKGHGHSIRGQAMAKNGVIVEMSSLNNNINNNENCGVRVSWDSGLGFYADVGGEQLWIDVLRSTLEYGLAPVSWTDYLYLTVGGTLSNAGISGQTFRYGPQISNVHEMDVITGKGELVTCSKDMNSELFFGVLGGLGQFGIITRARIVLDKAPTRELKKLVKGLKYLGGFMFKKDVSFVEFLNRVRSGELELQSKGKWDVPHPWLNLFVPKSSIMHFHAAVFVDIILRQNKTTGPILVYPTSRKRV